VGPRVNADGKRPVKIEASRATGELLGRGPRELELQEWAGQLWTVMLTPELKVLPPAPEA
jgi:hypothetical protein